MDQRLKKPMNADNISLYDMFSALHVLTKSRETIVAKIQEYEQSSGKKYLNTLDDTDRIIHFDMKLKVESHLKEITEKFYSMYNDLFETHKKLANKNNCR